MSETYTPAGNVGSSLQRATAGEAATGTHGQEFMRDDMTKIADKIRFLSDAGFPTVSKIQFPAVQVPDADANALDDYEEGSWTPSLLFGGAAVGLTYTTRYGSYTKIGNRVLATFFLALGAKGSSVGAASITGLPFVLPVLKHSPLALRLDVVAFSGFPQGYAPAGGAVMLLENQPAVGGGAAALTDTGFSNTSTVMGSLSYEI